MDRANTSYHEFFSTATGWPPFAFQERYAEMATTPAIVEISTGLGKTEATILPFLFAIARGTASARRLVYVLPMRSLVEQTQSRVKRWIDNLSRSGFGSLPKMAVLLGGDVDDTWLAEPEAPYILIGTQDMLLSRALNRGYASSPFRWPMAFALLNNDVHWVIDEVQLQGAGARTAAQLQGLRRKLGTFGASTATFLSATIERSWIDTVDHSVSADDVFELNDDERAEPEVAKRLNAVKRVEALDIGLDETGKLADAVVRMHRQGTLTLVVVNRVGRAQRLARAVRKAFDGAGKEVPVHLLHSRFRPPDRKAIVQRALEPPEAGGPGTIVVSTQVVEAGVDIDAATLISELAPWSSIVQRLGRCNRRGCDPEARFAWLDIDTSVRNAAAPYHAAELDEARAALRELDGISAAPASLPRLRINLEAGATLRRADLLDFFDTALDLSGSRADIGRFIREADDFTVTVFWRDNPPGSGADRPRRDELCSAPIGDVRGMVDLLLKQKKRESVRVRSALAEDSDELWRPAGNEDVVPGALIWLKRDVGGYSAAEGFDPGSKALVPEPRITESADDPRSDPPDETEQNGGDRGSWIGVAVTLADHSAHARREAEALATALVGTVGPENADAVVRAATWHDAGKVHAVFQHTMTQSGAGADGGPWAKGITAKRHERPHFRHELVSALAWLELHDAGRTDDLIAYIVAAHHGKLRVAAWPFPGEPVTTSRMILGVLDGEAVTEATLAAGEQAPAFQVDLGLFEVGSSDGRSTWSDRVLDLRDDPALGPFRLAYLETLVRVADWRASSKERDADGGASA